MLLKVVSNILLNFETNEIEFKKKKLYEVGTLRACVNSSLSITVGSFSRHIGCGNENFKKAIV